MFYFRTMANCTLEDEFVENNVGQMGWPQIAPFGTHKKLG